MEVTQYMKDTGVLVEPVECDLADADYGNAFALIGHWSKCARKAGRTADEIAIVQHEAMADDYDHLVGTLARHCADYWEDVSF
jgi:hypothetical protein